jgi:hypothetical protein
MDQIGAFTPEQARNLWQDYLRRQQLMPSLQYNTQIRSPLYDPQTYRVSVLNTTSERIPPYACMRVIGTQDEHHGTVVLVEKPTATDGEFLFNSEYGIEVGAIGWAYRYGVVVMMGEPPTAANVGYQPIVDSWEIEEGGSQFTVYGPHDLDVETDRGLIGRIGSVGGGDYFWFTVDSLVCPGEDPTNFPDGGLIVTATYSPTGTFPRGRQDDGTYYVYDYMGILDFSIDAVDNINGSKGRCSWGAEIGTTDFMWILDSIIVQPSCA